MTVYFLTSIHGFKSLEDTYQTIYDLLKKSKHKVLTGHAWGTTPRDMTQMDEDENLQFYRDVHGQVKKADVIFCEASYPSTSVGYMLSYAVSLGKPVVIFYSGNERPHLFDVIDKANDKVSLVQYESIDELSKEVPLMLDFVRDMQDTRFNFFVSPDISYYLDWISKHRKVPRSVYLRRLIDEDMAENEEYNAI